MLHVTIVYDPINGPARADGTIDPFYLWVLDTEWTDDRALITTGTFDVLTRFRLGVKEGEITLDIEHDGNTHPVRSDGMLSNWGTIPDYGLDPLGRLLG